MVPKNQHELFKEQERQATEGADGRLSSQIMLIDPRDQTDEEAIFHLSSEEEPDVIVISDTETASYDAKHLARRVRYHFSTARIVLAVEKDVLMKDNPFEGYKSCHYAAAPDALSDFLKTSGDLPEKTGLDIGYVVNEQLLKEDSDAAAGATTVQQGSVLDRPQDIGSYVPGTPNVAKKISIEESPAQILSRKRKTGRILLVVPSQAHVFGDGLKPAYPALGVLYVAGALEKAGHTVEVIDQDADEMSRDAIVNHFEKGDFDILGLTATTPTYENAVEITKAVKERCPDTPAIFGGIHATIDPIECTKEGTFEYVAVGEAECTAIEIVDAIFDDSIDLKSIRGLAYMGDDGKVVVTMPRALIPELDDYPDPAHTLVRNREKYDPADAERPRVAAIMVSRGCPGLCTYCQTKNIFGRRTRFRSPQRVLEEIRTLVYDHGVEEVHFLDDVLTASKTFVREFFPLLIAEPYDLVLRVPNGLRADMVNEETLTLMREGGLRSVCFGIESGNDEIIESVKKGISKDRVKEAVEVSKKVGLETVGFFIIGLPGDTESSVMDTINFAIDLDVKFAKFLILKPFPGSEVYYQLDEKGLIDSHEFTDYGTYRPPVHHLEDLTQERILQLQKKAFRKFYFRPGKVWEHVRGINSFSRFRAAVRGGFFVIERAISFNWLSKALNRT